MTDNDGAKRAYLLRAVAYSLFSRNLHRKFFTLYSPGGHTGKSTCCSVVLMIGGDYARTADSESFMWKQHTGRAPRDDLAQLAGYRVVILSETAKGARINSGLVKNWCGNDLVSFRNLYAKKNIQFYAPILWFHSNHRPRAPHDDSAFRDRMRIIEFKHVIEVEKPEIGILLCDPKRSGPGILNSILSGWSDYQKNGLDDPECVKVAGLEYERALNPLAQWFNANYELTPGNYELWMSTADLHTDYQAYCLDKKTWTKLSRSEFGKELGVLGLVAKMEGHSKTRGWTGFKPLDPDAPEREPGEDAEADDLTLDDSEPHETEEVTPF